MATVQLRGVSKSYSEGAANVGHPAVRQIDFDVQDGELVVLLGPSGCGKTTTLRMIAGLEDVSEGEISIGGRVVNQVSPQGVVNSVPPKDRNIAMVFQNYALYPHMNVYRNLAFGLELKYKCDWWSRAWLAVTQPKLAAELSVERQRIPERVRKTAEMLGIEHLLQRTPGELSGGEKQRVALGRAIVRQPAVFLFDEPLSNLDAQLRTEMRREIKRLHHELKATMIYVTHDQVEAMTLGDRIVVMNQGKIRQVGTPLEVYDKPADLFVAGFIGSPPMNLIEGKLSKGETGNWVFHPNVKVGAAYYQVTDAIAPGYLTEERNIILGQRPEDFTVEIPENENDIGWDFEVETVELLGDTMLLQVRGFLRPGTLEDGEPLKPHPDILAQPRMKLTVKVFGRLNVQIGSRVKLQNCNIGYENWFDAETGKRINSDSKTETSA